MPSLFIMFPVEQCVALSSLFGTARGPASLRKQVAALYIFREIPDCMLSRTRRKYYFWHIVFPYAGLARADKRTTARAAICRKANFDCKTKSLGDVLPHRAEVGFPKHAEKIAASAYGLLPTGLQESQLMASLASCHFKEECSPWNNRGYLPNRTSRTFTSAGLTPGMREA